MWSVTLAAAAVSALVLWSYAWSSQAGAVDIGASILGLIACLAAIGVLLVSNEPIPISRVMMAGIAFLGWSLVAALASGRGWTAFSGEATSMLGWLALASVGAVALAGAVFSADLRWLFSRFAWLVVLVQAIVSTSQIARGEVAIGTLPNSSYYGQAMLLLLPWCVVGIGDARPLERGMRYGTAIATIALLAAGGSRSAAACAVVWCLWVAVRKWGTSTQSKIAIGTSILSAAAIASYLYARSELLGTLELGSTFGLRPALWKLAWAATLERPILGWGPDGFVAGGSAVSTLALAQREVIPVFQPGSTDPHGIIFWVAVSGGLFALALLVWFVLETVAAWRWNGDRSDEGSAAIWAVATFFIVSLLSPIPIQVLPLFALLLGVSLSGVIVGDPESASSLAGFTALRLPLWAVRVGLVVLAASALLYAANAATRAKYEQASPERSPLVAPAAQRASDLWVFDPYLAYLSSLHWGYAALMDKSVAARTPDLQCIQRATALDARNPFFALEAARTLRFYGASPGAIEEAFTETFERYPFHPLGRAEYAFFLAEQGRREAAEEQLELAALGDQTGNDERMRVIDATRAVLEGLRRE